MKLIAQKMWMKIDFEVLKNFAPVKPRPINFPHHSLISIERQNVLAIVNLKQIIQYLTTKLTNGFIDLN